MSTDGSVLLALAACCLALAALQAAAWPRPLQWAMALAVVAALAASGELASRTSTAEILRWAASPQRRQDLAALLLAEALLFGSQAVRQAQGQATRGWRWLGWLPPPSALLALFFAQVAVMLWVDGWDYATLAWLCALGFAALLAAATALLRQALPDGATRCALRVGLHGAQAVAGLWLARPPLRAAIDPVPLWGGRLAIVAAVAAALAALGWLAQRRR
ncbi:hypothetical protein [Pseudorhodoferax sp.]|uniref:hypothetical protein n=1 Tax=Pseudorhodoferax sp. TaxID=1993553 RepID=UPI0039E4F7CD